MLSIPKLDDPGYELLVQRARGRIPMHTDEWTDFNDHDPGMTILQTYAWLVDTLGFYIDATGEQHRLAYLSLLGLRPELAAAACTIALSRDGGRIALARGAKLAAGDTVFELEESYSAEANAMTAIYCEQGGRLLDLTAFAGKDGGFATVFSHDHVRDETLYIAFEHALEEDIRLYVDIQAHPARVPFIDDFTLARLAWEYYDGERWQSAQQGVDETCGLLKSGFLHLHIPATTSAMRRNPLLTDGHYLRARLVEGGWDALPKIGRIYTNCVRAVQTHTFAQTIICRYDGESALAIDYHVRDDDVISVAVGDASGYSLWYEHAPSADACCDVRAGSHPWQHVIHFDRQRYGCVPEIGQEILIVIADAHVYDRLELGSVGGYARERLAVDFQDVYELRIALVSVQDGRPFYRIWDGCDNLSQAACDAQRFEYDRDSGEIVFGDSIAGLQPEAGQRAVAIQLKTSLLDAGNVRSEQVNRLLDGSDGLTAQNPADASGGKRPKTAQELEGEIEGSIYKTTRAVTAQDYIELVMRTPGLMIRRVNVISGRAYEAAYGEKQPPNTVFLAVQPHSEHEANPTLGEAYRRRIAENLEQYRLLTTQLHIIGARYVRVSVDGVIALNENTAHNRQRVRDALEQLVRTGKFGADIVYGKAFSQLEVLDCVRKVSGLAFSCIGEGAHKDAQGGVVIHPDALAYLDEINIEYS